MFRLLPIATVDRAVRALSEAAESVAAGYSKRDEHPVDLRDRYVKWSVAIEPALLAVFRREDVFAVFESPRHRDICSMAPGNQLVSLINAELDDKRAVFNAANDALVAARDRMLGAVGVPVVMDSNLLLQSLLPDQIGWNTLLGTALRLVLPMRVVEELDSKKYSDSKRLRDTARAVLPWLERTLGTGIGPAPVDANAQTRDAVGTTIEVHPCGRPRLRPQDADEEVLDVAQEVLHLAGKVVVLTGDTSMRIRARGEGFETLAIPDKWRRPTPS